MPRFLQKALLASIPICVLLATVPVAKAADQRYIWCWAAPVNPDIRKTFYTRVFVGDFSEMIPIKAAFAKYVRDTYPDDNTGPAVCNFVMTRDEASAALLKAKANTKWNELEVVNTDWTYSE